jgi:hypothetical protein
MNPIDQPITEDDIANFLANTPDFFERHAELLATVQLSRQPGGEFARAPGGAAARQNQGP